MKNTELYTWAAKALGLLIIFLQPIRSIMIATMVLIFADFITGVMASKKEGKKLTSSGFRRTFVKAFAYAMAIFVAQVLEQYLLSDLPIVKAFAGLIGLTEGKSFFENIHRLTGIDFWAMIISKLNMEDAKQDDKK